MRDLPEIKDILSLAEAAEEGPLRARFRSIAEREGRGGPGYEPIRCVLALRYGAATDVTLLRRLAAEIRAGQFDAPTLEAVWLERLLWDLTEERLRENNPGFLCRSAISAKM